MRTCGHALTCEAMSVRHDMLEELLPRVIELRHRLHQIPELGYEEFETAAAIRAELHRLGIAYIAGVPDAPTATVAWLGDTSRPCVALRADIDALPIEEHTDLPYRSRHSGRMHACGHDGHCAALVGAAALLKAREKSLDVCVKLIFQPAEEGGGGAARLVAAGVLDGRIGPPVSAIFALHGWPGLPVGTVATKAGAILAATDNFTVTIAGRGTHGGYPHLGRDPIVAMCHAVVALQEIVSREMDPTEPAVITVGQISGGSAVNVVPDAAEFSGTVRTLSEAARRLVRQAMERRCAGIAAAHDCRSDVRWLDGYPPTENDPALADYVAVAARRAIGERAFITVAGPSMGGEDFAFYLQKVPGCFVLIGTAARQGNVPTLHSDRYDFADEALPTAVSLLAELATGYRS